MIVTYIHHSSFCVELERTALLFDYTEGALPVIPAGKELLVFASHFHGDHFSPDIFRLADKRERVRYILSREIGKKKLPGLLPDRVRFVRAGETFEEAGARIETLHSTDEGVAFWISCEGKEIYHAGDLNNWRWEGEDKAWNHNMDANYRREMEKLAGRTADAAFIPLDPRLGPWFYLGMEGFMKQASAKALFPMHFWGDYGVIEAVRKHPAAAGWAGRVVSIHREGETFIL